MKIIGKNNNNDTETMERKKETTFMHNDHYG